MPPVTARVAVAVKPSTGRSSRASERISGSCMSMPTLPRAGQRGRDPWLGLSPWSERNLRTSVTTFCKAASSSSAASSTSAWSAAGQAARNTVSPLVSAIHSSSVTNG